MRIDMKMEKMSQKALERKSNKPIMEKKRRARINHCLNQLKALILETDNERSRHSKLEKADILEMTVKYLQTLRAYHLHLQQLHQLSQQQQQQTSPLPLTNHLNLHFQQPLPGQIQHQQQQVAHQLQLQLPLQLQQQQQQQQHNHHHHQHQNHSSQPSPTWRPW